MEKYTLSEAMKNLIKELSLEDNLPYAEKKQIVSIGMWKRVVKKKMNKKPPTGH